MKNLVKRFAKDESGATAIEYGLIAALISVVIIAVLTSIGEELNAKFTDVETGLKSILLEPEDGPVELPASVELESAYPNPFNPSTTVVYSLPTAARLTLALHDVTGRAVRTMDLGFVPAGRHETIVDAAELASGVYLLRLQAGTETRTHAVTLLR